MNTRSDWPPDCPPADANDLPLFVYRVVKNTALEMEDFRSWHEEGRGGPSDKECLRRGLSLFTSLEDAFHHIELFGDKPHIASADLSESHGRAKRTPTGKFPQHATWWRETTLTDEALLALFKVIQ